MTRKHEVEYLANAMWQLLDDMGKRGASVCLAAKAEARIAFEPFADDDCPLDNLMTLDEARAVMAECG